MKRFVLLTVLAACRGDAPARQGGSASALVSPGCDRELASWLEGVTVEDDSPSESITPPLLDVRPSKPRGGPHIQINADVITLDGTIVADMRDPKLASGLHDAVAALPPTQLDIHADRSVPFSVIALVAHEAAATGHTHVAFEVIAGHRTAKRPPPSSIDADIAAWDRAFDAMPLAQRLGNPPKSDFWSRVLRDCPGALAVVQTAGSGDASPASVIAANLPAATAACGCHIELAALERLLWRLYGREWTVPHAWISVELGAGRGWIERGTTPWGAAVSRLAAAAATPGPITLGAN